MHVLPSRFRAYANKERFGEIGDDLNQKHMEKDMEIMVKKSNIEFFNSWIFGQFL